MAKKKLPSAIDSNPVAALHYLAALVDGEGCVHFSFSSRGYFNRSVDITNTDLGIIDAAKRCAKTLGIPTREYQCLRYSDKHSPCYRVDLAGGRETFEWLADNLPLMSSVKLRKLREIVNSYKPVCERPTPTELDVMYNERDMTASEISEIYEVSPRSVLNWMEQAGIKRRPAHKRREIAYA